MSRLLSALKLSAVIFGFVLLTGCSPGQPAGGDAGEPLQLSAWLTHWDWADGDRELKRWENQLSSLSYFAATFDANDRLVVAPELSQPRPKTGGYTRYLTFVNDRENADGSVTLKDTAVLQRLLTDETALDRHIDEIIALTAAGGYNGIEIDYERVWKEQPLTEPFSRFISRLYTRALQSGLGLRVVLEPGTPFQTAGLISGPEYVVMFYNLYGLHSSPGPKADAEFIQKTAARMAVLPGTKAAAFAGGGCLWGDNGEKRFLTEVEARTLAALHAVRPQRDESSQSLVFSYQENGVSYQVWYADFLTLRAWIRTAQSQGISSIFLWRLGGNVDSHKLL
ncbi:MAG: hypothetical protein E6X17_02745 [Sporomusaceae bacterium]|nr:hypothetical protein [Sporomusaceae bacterium]